MATMPYTDGQIDNAVNGDDQDIKNNIKNKVQETATKAKEKAGEVGRNVQNKMDETRGPAAEKLESAAAALHEKAGALPGGETVAGFAHSAADKMQTTADYVRKRDVQGMIRDVEAFVRKRPGPSLLAAAVVGFFIGRTCRSDD